MQNFQTSTLAGSNQSIKITTATNCKTELTAFLNAADLHKQFLTLGRERNKITYKLLALLPQIYKQKIYEKHGYATIYEYAGKLAGLSYSVVEKALKLEKKLENKPLLQKAIETCGVHKVAIVANLATPETEKMFVDKLENMSKPALQQLSKEIRGKMTGKFQTTWQIEMDEEMMKTFLRLKKNLGKFGSNLSNKEAMRRMLKKWGDMVVVGTARASVGKVVESAALVVGKVEESGKSATANEEVTALAAVANNKLSRNAGGIRENNKIQKNESKPMMVKIEKPQGQAKKDQKIPGDFCGEGRSTPATSTPARRTNGRSTRFARSAPTHSSATANNSAPTTSAPTAPTLALPTNMALRRQHSRHIPTAKKRLILAKTNGGCAHPNCQNPAQIFHHKIRYCQSKSHESVIALCRVHHEFAHNGITENISRADGLYRKHRQIALIKNSNSSPKS